MPDLVSRLHRKIEEREAAAMNAAMDASRNEYVNVLMSLFGNHRELIRIFSQDTKKNRRVIVPKAREDDLTSPLCKIRHLISRFCSPSAAHNLYLHRGRTKTTFVNPWCDCLSSKDNVPSGAISMLHFCVTAVPNPCPSGTRHRLSISKESVPNLLHFLCNQTLTHSSKIKSANNFNVRYLSPLPT